MPRVSTNPRLDAPGPLLIMQIEPGAKPLEDLSIIQSLGEHHAEHRQVRVTLDPQPVRLRPVLPPALRRLSGASEGSRHSPANLLKSQRDPLRVDLQLAAAAEGPSPTERAHLHFV